MTLYELLKEQSAKYINSAFGELCGTNDEKFYKDLGRTEMCESLFSILSDDTLSMEVKTRSEAIKTPKKKTDDKIYKYMYPF